MKNKDMIRGTHFAEDLDSLADGIVERYGEPGLTAGPHPRSPAVAERLGYLRGLRQAAEMVRDSIVKDGGDWKQHDEHFGKGA